MSGQDLNTILITLLKGPVFIDTHQKLWGDLVAKQAQINDFFVQLNLEIFIDEIDGYAFLREHLPVSAEGEEELDSAASLISKHRLGYRISVLLALLRQRLVELVTQDAQTRPIVSLDEMVSSMSLVQKDSGNEVKLRKDIEQDMKKIEKMGVIRSLKGDKELYEIRNIIAAVVNADWLAELKQKLEAGSEI